jgi:hypothetical protein
MFVTQPPVKKTSSYLPAAVVAPTVLRNISIDKHPGSGCSDRVFSTLGQPNWLAAFLAALFPISLYFFVTNSARATAMQIIKHLFGGLTAILFFLVILYTRSRSGLLGLAVADILFWILLFLSSKNKKAIKVPFLVVHAVLFIIVFFNGIHVDQITAGLLLTLKIVTQRTGARNTKSCLRDAPGIRRHGIRHYQKIRLAGGRNCMARQYEKYVDRDRHRNIRICLLSIPARRTQYDQRMGFPIQQSTQRIPELLGNHGTFRPRQLSPVIWNIYCFISNLKNMLSFCLIFRLGFILSQISSDFPCHYAALLFCSPPSSPSAANRLWQPKLNISKYFFSLSCLLLVLLCW